MKSRESDQVFAEQVRLIYSGVSYATLVTLTVGAILVYAHRQIASFGTDTSHALATPTHDRVQNLYPVNPVPEEIRMVRLQTGPNGKSLILIIVRISKPIRSQVSR